MTQLPEWSEENLPKIKPVWEAIREAINAGMVANTIPQEPETPVTQPETPSIKGVEVAVNNYGGDWNKGVWTKDKAGISIPLNEKTKAAFVKGVEVKLKDGDTRTIEWVQYVGDNISVWLKGTILSPEVGAPHTVVALVDVPEDIPSSGTDKEPEMSIGEIEASNFNFSGAGHNSGAIPGTNFSGSTTVYNAPRDEDFGRFKKDTGFRIAGLARRFIPNVKDIDPKTMLPKLDENYCKLFDIMFEAAEKRGQLILLDAFHDYGRRNAGDNNTIVGAPGFPLSDFIASTLAVYNRFKDKKALWGYSLMNEPHSMGQYDWWDAGAATIDALEAFGCTHPIGMPGNNYTGSRNWQKSNPKYPLRGKDGKPKKNVFYDAHCYLDGRAEGLYRQEDPNIQQGDPMYLGVDKKTGVKWRKTREIAKPNVFVDRLKEIAECAKRDGTFFILGETGIPHSEWGLTDEQNKAFEVALKNGLDFMLQNNISWWVFAAGPGHSRNAVNGLQFNNKFRTPMELYESYRGKKVKIIMKK